jgi:hypothetical protein
MELVCGQILQEELWFKQEVPNHGTKQDWINSNSYDYFVYLYICKDTWFINFRTSQHFTFQKEVFSTFEEFSLGHKVYFGKNNILYMCGKGNIVFKLSNGISKCIGDVL